MSDTANGSARRLGIVAGTGEFPLFIARTARGSGYEVHAFCLSDHENESLRPLAQSFQVIKLTKLSSFIDLAHELGLKELILAGRIPHEVLLNPLLFLDQRIRRILGSIANKKADTVLGAFTQELEREGFTVLDSTMFVESLMPEPGNLTPALSLGEELQREIDFGYETAKGIAALDIGQAVAVKNGVVVAVEALEGTDKMIARAGELAGEGATIVKVTKPRQSRKFDVPIIGLDTIRNLAAIRASAICITARQSLFFNREEAVALAQEHGIVIYAHDERAETPSPCDGA